MTLTFPTPAEYLSALIKDGGLLQRRVAEAIGVSPSRLNKWLKGVEPLPRWHEMPILEAIDAPPSSLAVLNRLMNISDWKQRLLDLCKSEDIVAIDSRLPNALHNYIYQLCERYTMADCAIDPALDQMRGFAWHLRSAHFALSSAVDALRKDALFNEHNIFGHIRYPVNYYLSALLTLNDGIGHGGTELASAVADFIQEAAEDRDPRDAIIRMHARHMLARSTGGDADPRLSLRGVHHDDAQMKRMVLAGRALRPSATDRDIGALLDELTANDTIRRASVAFDLAHYDEGAVGKKPLDAGPRAGRCAILRALVGLDDPREWFRVFAAERLRILLDHVGAAAVRDGAIQDRVRLLRDGAATSLSATARLALDDIERAREQK